MVPLLNLETALRLKCEIDVRLEGNLKGVLDFCQFLGSLCR